MSRPFPNWLYVMSIGLFAWLLHGLIVAIVAVVAYWGVTGTLGWGLLILASNRKAAGNDNGGRAFLSSLMRMRRIVWLSGTIALAVSKAALMLPIA